MQMTQTQIFTFGPAATDPPFTFQVPAETKEKAIEKLAAALTAILQDLRTMENMKTN